MPTSINAIIERKGKSSKAKLLNTHLLGVPQTKALLVEKLTEDIRDLQEELGDALNMPLDEMRVLQGRIKALKDTLFVVSGTT